LPKFGWTELRLLRAHRVYRLAEASDFTAAIRVYGGDFCAAHRSEWKPETLRMRPSDSNRAWVTFAEANRCHAADLRYRAPRGPLAEGSVASGSGAPPLWRHAPPPAQSAVRHHVTGAGLNSVSALRNRHFSLHVRRRPLATSSIMRNSSQPVSAIVTLPLAMRPASKSIRSCQRRASSLRVATLITGTAASP